MLNPQTNKNKNITKYNNNQANIMEILSLCKWKQIQKGS